MPGQIKEHFLVSAWVGRRVLALSFCGVAEVLIIAW
jgi:hypothetical protein